MACSFCGISGHNIRSCDVAHYSTERRSGVDRRRSPRSALVLPKQCTRPIRFDDCSLPRLLALCNKERDCLVHLYWPQRVSYFEENLILLKEQERWLLVATPGHGLRGTQRPSLNFIVPNKEFVDHYPSAAQARCFHHGVLIRRAAIEDWSNRPGYEMAEIKVVRNLVC